MPERRLDESGSNVHSDRSVLDKTTALPSHHVTTQHPSATPFQHTTCYHHYYDPWHTLLAPMTTSTSLTTAPAKVIRVSRKAVRRRLLKVIQL